MVKLTDLARPDKALPAKAGRARNRIVDVVWLNALVIIEDYTYMSLSAISLGRARLLRTVQRLV